LAGIKASRRRCWAASAAYRAMWAALCWGDRELRRWLCFSDTKSVAFLLLVLI
jgi:hypothetical protein